MKSKLRLYRSPSVSAGASSSNSSVHIASLRKPARQAPTPADFYAAEIDGLKEYRNDWAWGHCPFHADTNPSFTANLETGAFRCMSSSCGASGSNIVSFVSQRDGLSYREARRFLEDWS